jgi:phosphotriesterase-related protein
MSRASGVHVVACTGFHLSDYYLPDFEIWEYTSDQAAEYFLDEIRNGLRETRGSEEIVYPGFIKIAVREAIESSPIQLIEGAVAASLESGYLIEMHTEKGVGAELFLDHLSRMGLPSDRLVFCHIDKRPDFALHRELAGEGCLLEYDTFFRPKYNPEQGVWPLLREMVGAGFDRSIACATDLADSSQWHSYGGEPGLVGFVVDLKGQLVDEQFGEEVIDRILGENIAERLVVDFKEISL